ncbi:TetR/AcrR family transcriptional regulator [Nocardia africana]|uniref:Pyrimidine utilization regulatory protein R n=1 Tax=Nocardia africana TaxID=134964 RepID=A0A378WYV8_9NOCA|nr:TetR/AcrR family transcriptional regulator [Nocardia africana]MCC3313060.1 TetR/AcrR family transcriptional regulator [Nocardia africana]SUA45591.1 pyrimidine utilization regulatory protein R [Nocardia africana]
MTGESFQRARTDAQRAERVHAILQAARALLVTVDVTSLSLGAISREANLAASNVLRYFGSREALLLDLMDAEYRSWTPQLEARIREHHGPLDVDEVAAIVADALAERPILARLIAASAELLQYPMPEAARERCREQGRHNQAELSRILTAALGIELRARDQAYLVAGFHAVVTAVSAWSNQPTFPVETTGAVRELLAIQLQGLICRRASRPGGEHDPACATRGMPEASRE